MASPVVARKRKRIVTGSDAADLALTALIHPGNVTVRDNFNGYSMKDQLADIADSRKPEGVFQTCLR